MLDWHYWMVRLKYSMWVEPQLIWNYYKPFMHKAKRDNSIFVFMADGKRPHGGMFDRIKGILTVFALAKAQNAEFKIHFVSPFDLRDYLDESGYKWKTEFSELCFHYPCSRPLIVYGECFHPNRLLKKRSGETHVYYGFDSIEEINKKYHTHFEFSSLYSELFKPGKQLQERIDKQKEKLGQNYVVSHIRFTNLLGDQVEIYGEGCKTLGLQERKKLMAACCNAMKEILNEHANEKMLLTTDSNLFVEYIRGKLPEICFVEGNVKHVDTAASTSAEENLKLFMDYYMIAQASHVYSLVGGDLYPSQFPKYAARIGNVPFDRVWVKEYDFTPWIIQ